MPRKQTSELEIDVARIEEREKANAEWKKEVNDHLADIDKKLEELPDLLITKLDERYASKQKVAEIEETVAPFTAWRKRVWYALVGVLVVGAIELAIMSSVVKQFIKQI